MFSSQVARFHRLREKPLVFDHDYDRDYDHDDQHEHEHRQEQEHDGRHG